MDKPISLGLLKMEYPVSSDIFHIALAESLYDVNNPKARRVFQKTGPSGSSQVLETLPVHDPDPNSGWALWMQSLDAAQIDVHNVSEREVVADALLNSLKGVRPESSKSVVAIPISPMTALLQNRKGVANRDSPPNFAKDLEQLYVLGGGSPGGVANGWKASMKIRLQCDPLAKAVEKAVESSLLSGFAPTEKNTPPDPPFDHPSDLVDLISSWNAAGEIVTPMAWFVQKWDEITSEDWVRALPARRWVDWASTVLRHGFAFGVLWQSHFYRKLVELVMEPSATVDERSLKACATSAGMLLNWPAAGLSPSSSAVTIKREVELGVRATNHFGTLEFPGGTDVLSAVTAMKSDPDSRKSLSEALLSKAGAARVNNNWEAIRYALLRRVENGTDADHYGLFRVSKNNWLYVDPGAEWISVMASLEAGAPGGRTTASQLHSGLNQLGINIKLTELLRHVESSGLAELAADADQAVVVKAAF